MKANQLQKTTPESNAHFIFRNICAIITVLLAISFLYQLFDIKLQVHDQEQFVNNMANEYSSEYLSQGFEEVMLEDYGSIMPSFDFSGILNIILLILCVAACVLSNVANGHLVRPFYRTSVIATAIVIVTQLILASPLKVFLPILLATFMQGVDANMETVAGMNYELPHTIIYICILILAFLLAFIPASIARKKNHSYALFFVFGYLLFLPALAVSLCIGDKYDDEKINGKGILVVLGIGITLYLTKVFLTPIDAFFTYLSNKYYPQLMESEEITGMLLTLIALEVAVSFTLALLVALTVTKLLKKPIDFISVSLKGNHAKTMPVNYIGKNANYVCQLSRALPIAKKYERFFNRRDKLARYKKLDIDNVMAMVLPITLIGAILAAFIYKNVSAYLPLPLDQHVFPWRIYGCVVLGIFAVSCVLAKPIAILKCRKAQKLDTISEQKGYLQTIRNELPDFYQLRDEELRYKTLRDMRIIFRLGADGMAIDDARNYASLAKEGAAMAKIIAIAAVPVVLAKVAGDYENN